MIIIFPRKYDFITWSKVKMRIFFERLYICVNDHIKVSSKVFCRINETETTMCIFITYYKFERLVWLTPNIQENMIRDVFEHGLGCRFITFFLLNSSTCCLSVSQRFQSIFTFFSTRCVFHVKVHSKCIRNDLILYKIMMLRSGKISSNLPQNVFYHKMASRGHMCISKVNSCWPSVDQNMLNGFFMSKWTKNIFMMFSYLEN